MTARGSETVRVAVAGAGLMGRWHVRAARLAGARVTGIADPDAARAGLLAGRGARAYGDVAAMLEAETPDVLHLCTPTATHSGLCGLAMARGIHVLVEKPLAGSGAETAQLLAQAGAGGVRLCPVHQYAFQSSIETILRDRARAGPAALIELAFFSAGAAGRPPSAWPGVAADILPHPASILQRLYPGRMPGAGAWTIVSPAAGTFALSAAVDGALVRIVLSLTARPTCARLDLWGADGAFAADLFHDYALFRDGTASRASKMLRPFRDGFGHLGAASGNLAARALRGEAAYPGLAALCRRFYAALDGAAPDPIPAADILGVADLRDRFLAATASPAGTGATGAVPG